MFGIRSQIQLRPIDRIIFNTRDTRLLRAQPRDGGVAALPNLDGGKKNDDTLENTDKSLILYCTDYRAYVYINMKQKKKIIIIIGREISRRLSVMTDAENRGDIIIHVVLM